MAVDNLGFLASLFLSHPTYGSSVVRFGDQKTNKQRPDSFGLARYQPIYNANGNVRGLLTADAIPGHAAGAVVAAYDYSVFGELTVTMGTAPIAQANPIRFASKYLDTETGLYDYNHRFYDPVQGRFINRDPIGEMGGLNLYAYVRNSPANRWDWLGFEEGNDGIYVLPPFHVYDYPVDNIWEGAGRSEGNSGSGGTGGNDEVVTLDPLEVVDDPVNNHIFLHPDQFKPRAGGGAANNISFNIIFAPNKLGDELRKKQEHCQKLGDHIANLKGNIRAGIQDLGELGGHFQTANFLNQAQLVGTLVGGAGGVVAGVRHAATSASNSVLSGWMRAAGSPMPRSMLPAGVRDYAQASAGFAADAAIRGAPTGLVLDYAYTEVISNELPPIGVVLAPGGAAAEAIVSMTDTAAGRVMSAIQNQQSMLATSMAAYERDCK